MRTLWWTSDFLDMFLKLRNSEDYVHRVGRTGTQSDSPLVNSSNQSDLDISLCPQGRIGNKGIATSFVGPADPALKDLEHSEIHALDVKVNPDNSGTWKADMLKFLNVPVKLCLQYEWVSEGHLPFSFLLCFAHLEEAKNAVLISKCIKSPKILWRCLKIEQHVQVTLHLAWFF